MVRWLPRNFGAVLRRAGAVVVAALLMVVGPQLSPSAWHDLSSALAAPGGNGKGNNGNGKGNGGPTGAHEDQGSAAKAQKDKKDKSTGDSGADEAGDADQAAASADQAGSASDADTLASPATTKRAGRIPTAAVPERSGHDFVAGEIVVANMTDKTKLAAGRLGFVLLDERRLPALKLTLARLRVPRAMTAPTARRLLASRFPGISVDINALYRPQGTLVLPPPDYPAKLIGWGPVPAACGSGLRLGLLDTAVDTALPGLKGADIVQRSFLTAQSAAAPPDHGSAIAWILVGQRAGHAGGLLPGAELAVAGVFAADPQGVPTADVVALVSGLDWLAGRGTPVINMSFAGEPNTVVALALRRGIAGHAIVVAAAGNDGPTAPPPFPASAPGVIGVAAVDSHSRPYADGNRGDYIQFAAPGVRIWTPGLATTGSYHTGTSFAAPFVTAAVAARLAEGAKADSDRIVDSLAKMAIDLGLPGKDPVFGNGLIQSANPCSATASR